MKYRVVTNKGPILLGRQGENGVLTIRFPVNLFFPFTKADSYELVYQPSGCAAPYPCDTRLNDGFVDWVITADYVHTQGSGMAQLSALKDGQIEKTVIFTTVVTNSLGYTEKPPAPWTPWVNEVLFAARDAHESETQAAQSAAGAAQAKSDAEAAADLLENCSAEATTLEEGSEATASYSDGVFYFGIPRGDAGKNDTFVIAYDSEDVQSIEDALNAGEAVFCVKDSKLYPLTGRRDTGWIRYTFGIANDHSYERVYADDRDNSWSYSSTPTQLVVRFSVMPGTSTLRSSATPAEILAAINARVVIVGEDYQAGDDPTNPYPVSGALMNLVSYSASATNLLSAVFQNFYKAANSNDLVVTTIYYSTSGTPGWHKQTTTYTLPTT